ncbi:MAG: ATP-binding protein [Peptococcaceae bacterium]|nr:ATP-binding protein [Peptococcaceae bacterium]
MYITRHMEKTLAKTEKMFGAVIVTGSRQVGKTTLLRNATQGTPYVTLDDPILLQSALTEAGTFFKNTPPPVFIDEIQYAPNLFPYMKMIIDTDKKKGQFYLSGSQQFVMMKNVTESLAGRIGILNLPGLSLRETSGIPFNEPFIPTESYLRRRLESSKEIPYKDIWAAIHRGAMPEIYVDKTQDWGTFYGSYVRTYIERDVRELTQVGDEIKFLQFLTVMASRTGQLLNLAAAARDVGISQPTAERWLSVLVASNLVYLLQPWFTNITKRALKTPKLYFLDTGLAAYLTKWSTVDVLINGAMAGAFFETFIIAEIIKSYYNAGILDAPLYFYRDKDQHEIDLLIWQDGALHPIKIKKNADPHKTDIAAFKHLDNLSGIERGDGCVICLYDQLVSLHGEDKVVPVTLI